MLRKGVPSTFINIKGLYGDESKRSAIVGLVDSYLAELSSGSSTTNGDKPGRFKESCLFFLAQHYNYHITRDLEKALKYINEAIELDPKSVVYVLNRARIYKHLGEPEKAAAVMEEARLLDEKDRYINTKCAKYQLRNNENEKAVQTMSKFTRNEAVGGPLGDLMDMQCTWFLTEDGNAYRRQGKLGLALRRYKAVFDVFEIWQEDQFDFHHYSMRKGAVGAYVDMIHWQDHLREHPSFSRAAISAVEIYVALHDRPHLAQAGGGANGIANFEGMDASERKKAIKKAKRDQERRVKSDAAKAEKATPGGAPAAEKKKDVDADSQKLAETKTPLDDAMPYVNHLLDCSPRNVNAQLVAFDVYLRRSKCLDSFGLSLTQCRKVPDGVQVLAGGPPTGCQASWSARAGRVLCSRSSNRRRPASSRRRLHRLQQQLVHPCKGRLGGIQRTLPYRAPREGIAHICGSSGARPSGCQVQVGQRGLSWQHPTSQQGHD
jgi:peptide alpha-N-acetyltransferase